MQIVISVYFYLGKNTRSLFTYYDSFVLMLEFVSQHTGCAFFICKIFSGGIDMKKAKNHQPAVSAYHDAQRIFNRAVQRRRG